MSTIETIKLWGNYYVADRAEDFYLMIDTKNDKVVRLIDAECFFTIEQLLKEVKELR